MQSYLTPFFGRSGFEPIFLFEEQKVLKDLKSPLTVKKQTYKKRTHLFTLCHFKSDLLAVEDEKRRGYNFPQHHQDFLAQNTGLDPLSLSLSPESQQCLNVPKPRFYPELHLGSLSAFSGSHRWPGEPCLFCKTVIIWAEA